MDNATMLNKNLIKELGLENLPPEQQEEISMETGRVIYQNIVIRVLETLNEEDSEEFEKFLDEKSDNQDEIYEFLKSKIPNLEEIINEEVAKFKSGAISIMKAAFEE